MMFKDPKFHNERFVSTILLTTVETGSLVIEIDNDVNTCF